MGGVNKVNNHIIPVSQGMVRQPRIVDTQEEKSFKEALDIAAKQLDVNLSKHALLRMMDRKIQLDSSQVERLNAGVNRARGKGISDTLVLMDDKVFVVNVRSSTVITAAEGKDIKERVFTNIDGAVIV